MVDQDLPHQSFNLIALVLSFLAFLWGWGAFRRFYAVLNYRYAVLTENTVMLRGLGGCLSQFSGTMPSHTRSILHTRNAAAAKDVKFLYAPFHVQPMTPPEEGALDNVSSQTSNEMFSSNGSTSHLSIPVIGTAKDDEKNIHDHSKKVCFSPDVAGPYAYGVLNNTFSPHPTNLHELVPKHNSKLCGYVPVWCATDCTIYVMYGLHVDNLKRFFKYSIKANKLFSKGSKYRDKQDMFGTNIMKSKGKKKSAEGGASEKHIYAERLKSLFTKKDLCIAFSQFDPGTLKCSDLSNRIFHVPIYDTAERHDSAYLDPGEVALETSEEVDLTAGHGMNTFSPRGYARISNSNQDLNDQKANSQSTTGSSSMGVHIQDFLREHSQEHISSRSPSRFSRQVKTADTEGGSGNSINMDRKSFGILIIPRDLPYTGSPESVAARHTTELYKRGNSSDSTGHMPSDIGDIELGPTHGTSSPIHKNIDRSRYSLLDFGLQVFEPLSSPHDSSQPAYEMDDMYVHAAGALYTSSDVYGLNEMENDRETSPGDEESTECVICLTNTQEVFLLPCRHLCVCKECFPHIDKCPVCRSHFNDYVTITHDSLISVNAPKCSLRKRNSGQKENGNSESSGPHIEDDK